MFKWLKEVREKYNRTPGIQRLRTRDILNQGGGMKVNKRAVGMAAFNSFWEEGGGKSR